jgi:L-rhamnose mutarotase
MTKRINASLNSGELSRESIIDHFEGELFVLDNALRHILYGCNKEGAHEAYSVKLARAEIYKHNHDYVIKEAILTMLKMEFLERYVIVVSDNNKLFIKWLCDEIRVDDCKIDVSDEIKHWLYENLYITGGYISGAIRKTEEGDHPYVLDGGFMFHQYRIGSAYCEFERMGEARVIMHNDMDDDFITEAFNQSKENVADNLENPGIEIDCIMISIK